MGELNRPDRGYKSGGFIARGCGVMSNRRKNKDDVMAKNGLDKWFKQKWVDIGSKRKDGSFAKCGRSKQKKDAKRVSKSVPLAKARSISEAVLSRKERPGNKEIKPTNVATFARNKKADGGMVKQAQKITEVVISLVFVVKFLIQV